MLSDVFKYKDGEARRAILDRYNISKEDKNEFLNSINEGGGNDKIIYYKVKDNIEDDYGLFEAAAAQIKLILPSGEIVFRNIENHEPTTVDKDGKLIAFAFLPHDMYHDRQAFRANLKFNTLEEICEQFNIPFFDIVEGRISSEEYYERFGKKSKFKIAIDEVSITREVIFYIIKEYEYEEGMTLYDWINSKYNVDNIRIETNEVYYADFYESGEYPFNFSYKENTGDINFINNSSIINPLHTWEVRDRDTNKDVMVDYVIVTAKA